MQLNSKFDLGQTVYYFDEDSGFALECGEVEQILAKFDEAGKVEFEYNMGGECFVPESCVFADRETAEKTGGCVY